MTVQTRRIRADEWSRLRAIRLQALAEAPAAFGSTLAREQGYTDDAWRERAADGSAGCDRATFIAEHDGHWVGCATGLIPTAGGEHADPMLVGMFVAASVRQRGVGADLVNAVAAWASACGAARLTLWVSSGNDPAFALYQRCGFQPTGVTRPPEHALDSMGREMARYLQ